MVEKNSGIMTPQEMPPQLVHHQPCVWKETKKSAAFLEGSTSQPTPEAWTQMCHENIIITLVKPSNIITTPSLGTWSKKVVGIVTPQERGPSD
jgi:hypothetical protein